MITSGALSLLVGVALVLSAASILVLLLLFLLDIWNQRLW